MAEEKFTEKHILEILKEAESEPVISRICSKYDITPAELHLWKLRYGHDEVHAGELAPRDPVPGATIKILSVIMIIMGGMIIAWAALTMKEGGQAGLRPAPGKIVKTESTRLTGELGQTVYHFKIIYEYEVDGLTHRSSRVRRGPTYARDLKANPEGKAVTVYYDPANPDIAYLDPGVPPRALDEMRYGFYWIFAGLLVFCFGWWYSNALVESESAPE